jgi:hypothetical protein
MVRACSGRQPLGGVRVRGHLGRSSVLQRGGAHGDAAAASDPTWAQGLSLTLRDVRVLRDQLLMNDDWEAAHAYATEHDQYYGALHRIEGWAREFAL